MTAFSSTKSLKASVASALVLGAFATTPALAQFSTTGTYVLTGTDQQATPQAVTQATGNSKTLAVFQTNIATAFTSNTGGDITFEGTVIPNGTSTVNTTSLTATYGTAGANTLTVTQPVAIDAVANPAGGNEYGSYSTGTSGTGNETSGAQYLGFSNIATLAAGGSIYNFNFSFSQSLSDFGIMAINRAAARPLTFTVTLTDGTTVTPVTGQATSNGGPTFFEYTATGAAKIKSVDFTTTAGYTRFDDLGFVVAPAATPEPSQYAAMGLGVLGLGLLALCARKRTVMGR